MSRIREYAKKTFLAMKNPAGSVQEVFVNALDRIGEENDCQYMGVKNVRQIPADLVKKLEGKGFALYTLDRHSHNGRAVDYNLHNPITGRPMTGSSSGTAINVFLGINDLGIGTDGGGSVLAPAAAVNCFGFISPLIEAGHMKQYAKLSTDGIEFYPSIGFVTRDFSTMCKAVKSILPVTGNPGEEEAVILVSRALASRLESPITGEVPAAVPEAGNRREPLIGFLEEQLQRCDVFADFEEKIDFSGLGDTVLGHFDPVTAVVQNRSGKGLIRVANMVKATALTVPVRELSSCITLYCESTPEKTGKLLQVAAALVQPEDELIRRYFRDPAPYFEEGFTWHH